MKPTVCTLHQIAHFRKGFLSYAIHSIKWAEKDFLENCRVLLTHKNETKNREK